MAEVKQVSDPMINFLYALNEAILIKHLGPEMTAEVVAKIPDAPGVFDVGLPFYVEIPETDSAPPPTCT